MSASATASAASVAVLPACIDVKVCNVAGEGSLPISTVLLLAYVQPCDA